jgi:hypothetical protein
MMVPKKMFLFCIIVLTMVTTCYTERVEQPNNPGIESFTEQRFSKDEFQDQLFDEVDASHRLPRAISVQRPNIIGHSNPIHRPVQNHVQDEGDNRFGMPPRRRPVQHRDEDGGDDHFDTSHRRRPVQHRDEDGGDDHFDTSHRRRRPKQNHAGDEDDDHPAHKFPCPCPCGSSSYFVCPIGCEHYGYCPPCPCPCSHYDIDNLCPFGCRARDTCDSLWE